MMCYYLNVQFQGQRVKVSCFLLADRGTDSFVCEITKNWFYYTKTQIIRSVFCPFQTSGTINLWFVLTQFRNFISDSSLWIQSNPDNAPPSLSAYGSLWIEIPCYSLFRFTSTVDNLPQNAVGKQWRCVRSLSVFRVRSDAVHDCLLFAVEAFAVSTIQFRERNWLLEET